MITARGINYKTRRWGIAWIGLVLALALHVTDEALTGFLPLYNSTVESIRNTYPWVPLPTFIFPAWLGGLIIGVLALLALSPLVFGGTPWLRILSYVLGVIMVANALGHIGASFYLGYPAPGVYSSPVLLFSAVALLVTAYGSRANSGG